MKRLVMPSKQSFADVPIGVSDFVALVNQTFEYAYPNVTVRGELANFKISKNKWVYFDLKDETASVHCFGMVYQLSGPLENGMLLSVRGRPRLHPQYGFSLTVLHVQPEGEGSIRRVAELLHVTLAAEGLFDVTRKRPLPYPPVRIGLITSTESAAYADFVKVLGERWRGVAIDCADVLVQGEAAPEQIAAAIEQFGQQASPPEVLVLIRGGGSADDLYAFNTEQVTRAVAASRIPTLVAIGHEVDVSLAELAADRRASTPSNAAELLVPDWRQVRAQLDDAVRQLRGALHGIMHAQRRMLAAHVASLDDVYRSAVGRARFRLATAQQLLDVLNPRAVLRRGYAIVRASSDGRLVRRPADVPPGAIVEIELSDGRIAAAVQHKDTAD